MLSLDLLNPEVTDSPQIYFVVLCGRCMLKPGGRRWELGTGKCQIPISNFQKCRRCVDVCSVDIFVVLSTGPESSSTRVSRCVVAGFCYGARARLHGIGRNTNPGMINCYRKPRDFEEN